MSIHREGWKKGRYEAIGNLCAAIIMFSFLALFPFSLAFSENEAANTHANAPVQHDKNLNDYFRGKYKFHRLGSVRSSIRTTQHGPKGSLAIDGCEIKFENAWVYAGEQGQARAIAMAFLKEEAEVLGIVDQKEIEGYVHKDEDTGHVQVYFIRKINGLELWGSNIQIGLDPIGQIIYVSAEVIPLSFEAYEATIKKPLPQSKIRHIVEQDLKSFPPKFKPFGWKPGQTEMDIRKYAVPDPPYVIYRVKSIMQYDIDAFTGEILEKSRTWKY